MRMLMIIVESSHREKLEAALAEHRVHGFTEIPTAYGMGQSGLRLGSRAFPHTSSIVFTVIEEDEVEPLVRAIDAGCADCRAAMRILVWGIDRML